MANVRFGDTATTTPFPPTTPEDGRGAEAASVDPYRTVIRPGGAVTFHIPPFQQLAIYEPGVRLEEIRIEKETLFPASFGPFSITNYLVDDPHGRLLLSPEPKQEAHVWTTPAGTFEELGVHLVISTCVPYLSFFRMHGWVDVR